MTTTPKPPRGRRWLEPDEFVRKGDWIHSPDISKPWPANITMCRAEFSHLYPRKLKTKTRK